MRFTRALSPWTLGDPSVPGLNDDNTVHTLLDDDLAYCSARYDGQDSGYTCVSGQGADQ